MHTGKAKTKSVATPQLEDEIRQDNHASQRMPSKATTAPKASVKHADTEYPESIFKQFLEADVVEAHHGQPTDCQRWRFLPESQPAIWINVAFHSHFLSWSCERELHAMLWCVGRAVLSETLRFGRARDRYLQARTRQTPQPASRLCVGVDVQSEDCKTSHLGIWLGKNARTLKSSGPFPCIVRSFS